jgi:hypothetical protein
MCITNFNIYCLCALYFVILSYIIENNIVYCELETILNAVWLNFALKSVTSFSCSPFCYRIRSDGHFLLSVARLCLVHKPNILKSLFDPPADGRVGRSPSV